MSKAQDIIKAMVASLHQRHLKAQGFRKAGNTWVRPENWPQVVNVQLSSWNTGEEAKFTVNLGISIEALHGGAEGLPLKGSLKEYDCDLRSRIGQLLPDGQDRWWTVTPLSDADQLADEVFSDIEQYAFPWFARLTTYAAVATEFESRKVSFMAGLAYQLGDDAGKAEACMALAYAQANAHFLPKLKRLARVHGIPIPGVHDGSV